MKFKIGDRVHYKHTSGICKGEVVKETIYTIIQFNSNNKINKLSYENYGETNYSDNYNGWANEIFVLIKPCKPVTLGSLMEKRNAVQRL